MRTPLAALVMGVVVMTTACTSEKRAESPPAQTKAAPDSGAQQTPSASARSTTSPAVRVSVGRTQQYAAFLTDGNGRALYLLEEDRAGESTCYEMCAAIWPPFLAGQATPTAANPAVQSGLLGSITRRGGGTQVTYNGHPLYYYLGDAAPGQTRGQHVEDSWGEWYLVSPSGQHVGEESGGGRRGRGGRGSDDDRR